MYLLCIVDYAVKTEKTKGYTNTFEPIWKNKKLIHVKQTINLINEPQTNEIALFLK